MGYVLVFSLPMVIVFILLCFGCYAMGRSKGRQEARAAQEAAINPQPTVDGVMATGTPPPPPPPYQQHPAAFQSPPPYQQHPAAFPSPTPHNPNPHYMKQQNAIFVAST